jgi:hypothetical protein
MVGVVDAALQMAAVHWIVEPTDVLAESAIGRPPRVAAVMAKQRSARRRHSD